KPPEPARVGVADDSKAGQALAELLRPSAELNIITAPRAELDRRLDRGALDVIAQHEDGVLDLRYDPMRQEARLARLLVTTQFDKALGRAPVAELREATAMPRGARYIDFLMPGIIAMSLLGSSLWGV